MSDKPIRDEKGRFVKGAPNPVGRKALPKTVKDLFENATEDAARVIIELANDEKAEPHIRLKASEIILDRVYGKAAQSIHANIDSNITSQIDLSNLSVEQLLLLANAGEKQDVIEVEFTKEG